MYSKQLTAEIQAAAANLDENQWPEKVLEVVRKGRLFGDSIPTRFGGLGSSPLDRVRIYEALARGHMSTALILTQHDGACELLADCDNEDLASTLLPRLADGSALATVGISQLTTSRQGGVPAMAAQPDGGDYLMTGVMPWVTSARKADYIVSGAVLPDAKQFLACIDTNSEGLYVDEPIELLALTGSLTSAVRCEGLRVSRAALMRGPMEKALGRRSTVKSLTVSSCGIGMAGALLDMCQMLTSNTPSLADLVNGPIVQHYDRVRRRFYSVADSLNDPAAEIPAMDVRVEINDLVSRLALSLMNVLKGSGYVASHPGQRLVREAMFFLVWSAPVSVQANTLSRMWRSPG